MTTAWRLWDKVRLLNDVMATVKPWDVGEVMVQDGDICLVCWRHAWGNEYAWISIGDLVKLE